jgi:hypothetical protein
MYEGSGDLRINVVSMLMVKSDFVLNSGVGWNASALEREAATSASAQFQANHEALSIPSLESLRPGWQ